MSNKSIQDDATSQEAAEPRTVREAYNTPRLVSYGKFQHVTLQVSEEGDTGGDPDNPMGG